MTNLSRRRTRAVVTSVGLGMLLAALDQTVVSTAMPKVVAHLGSFDLYSWVFTAYMLTSTTTVPIYGKLSDIYGRKIFFLWGMVVFMAASILSGQASNMHELIIFRGIQGIGAGAMMPVALAIIGDLYPPAKRGKVQGLMGTVFGIASVVGPSLGGYITDNLNWRWVFYVNIPVGILAVAVVLAVMPWDRPRGTHRSIDYLGVATLIAGLTPLLLALSEAGTNHPWSSPYVLGLLATSVVMILAFVLVESRAREPLLPLRLFRTSIFSVSVLAVFLTGIAMFGTIMFIPLFVQGVIGSSATSSGRVLTPLMLAMIVGSISGGQLISRWGRYRLLALFGVAVLGVGMVLLSSMSTGTHSGTAVVYMMVGGFGLGITMPLYLIAVQNAFPHAQMGVVTSSIQFFRSIGGTLGVAVMGSLMTETFRQRMAAGMAGPLKSALGPNGLAELNNPQLLLNPDAKATIAQRLPSGSEDLLRQLIQTLRLALSGAITRIFLVAVGVIALAWVANLFLKEVPLRKSHHEAAFAEGTGSGPISETEPRPV